MSYPGRSVCCSGKELTEERSEVSNRQKSAEGIVGMDQERLFRHSMAKAGATDKHDCKDRSSKARTVPARD